jgi:hypothetical protein
MSESDERARAYPLQWPIGRPRAKYRQCAKFRRETDFGRQLLKPAEGARRVLDELERLGARNVVVRTNVRPRGLAESDDDRPPNDPGAAVYFLLDGKQHCLACDKWDRVADNLAAIAAHVDAVRRQLRMGVADSAAQAFAGFAALPAVRQWWEILGLPRNAPREEIKRRHHELAALHHPDRGGDAGKMAEVNEAVAAAERERAA